MRHELGAPWHTKAHESQKNRTLLKHPLPHCSTSSCLTMSVLGSRPRVDWGRVRLQKGIEQLGTARMIASSQLRHYGLGDDDGLPHLSRPVYLPLGSLRGPPHLLFFICSLLVAQRQFPGS
jgi:hypothetical protein